MLPLPTILDDAWLAERLVMAMPELGRRMRFFMNEHAVLTHCSAEGSVPVVTVFHYENAGGGHQYRPAWLNVVFAVGAVSRLARFHLLLPTSLVLLLLLQQGLLSVLSDDRHTP